MKYNSSSMTTILLSKPSYIFIRIYMKTTMMNIATNTIPSPDETKIKKELEKSIGDIYISGLEDIMDIYDMIKKKYKKYEPVLLLSKDYKLEYVKRNEMIKKLGKRKYKAMKDLMDAINA